MAADLGSGPPSAWSPSVLGDSQVSVVVLTHRRPDGLAHTLERLRALPEEPPIVVVDNAPGDGRATQVSRRHPGVQLVRAPGNLGAAGRNLGVARVRTPYVAFCDDDTWWAPGALARAQALLDEHPALGAIAARVLVGPENRLDPTCAQMARSPLTADDLPGPGLIGFMAGAVVMRTRAYREAGGYEPRFFLGAEEALLGLDLAGLGWRIAYADDVVTHHHPAPRRDAATRGATHKRNLLWLAWMRLPWALAWHETRRLLRDDPAPWRPGSPLRQALAAWPWVLQRRRVLPPPVVRDYLVVQRHVLPLARAQGAADRR